MHGSPWKGVATAAVLVMGACGESDSGTPVLPVVRDSAGIMIKEYQPASSATEWTLSGRPTLTIGAGGADSNLDLYRVRHARWLDSSIVVANAGSNEVLILDGKGALRTRVGREGDGPGEFRSLSDVQIVPPDSILAFDIRLGRFQVFDRDGNLARTFQLEQPSETPVSSFPVGLLSGRQLVARGLRLSDPNSNVSGVVRSTIDVATYDMTGLPTGEVTTAPAWEAYNPPEQSGGVRVTNTPIPFGARTLLGVLAGQIVVGATDRNEIRLIDRNGMTSLIFRGAGIPGPVITAEEAAAIKRDIVENSPAPMQARLRGVYQDMPIPAQRPAIRGLDIGQEGTIWVSSWPADSLAPTPVRVFDGEGDLIATARVPGALNITEIDGQRLMGIWTDSLGVESVRVYEIQKN